MQRLLLASLLVVACTGPFNVDNRYRLEGVRSLEPLEWYPAMFWRARECAGSLANRSARYDLVRWQQAERIVERSTKVEPAALTVQVVGRVSARIIIQRSWVESMAVVQHELLHYLLPGLGHKSPEFARCDPLQRGWV